jgi:hypothetical protein
VTKLGEKLIDALEDAKAFEEGKKELRVTERVKPVPPSIDPVDFAAKEFSMGIKPFKDALDRFSKKELIRVLSFIVESPLNDKPFKFVDKRAKVLADVGTHLLVCKMTMMQSAYKSQTKEKKSERRTETEIDESGRHHEKQEGQPLPKSEE